MKIIRSIILLTAVAVSGVVAAASSPGGTELTGTILSSVQIPQKCRSGMIQSCFSTDYSSSPFPFFPLPRTATTGLPDSTGCLISDILKCSVTRPWMKLELNFAGNYYLGLCNGGSFTPFARYGNHDRKIRIHHNTVAFSFSYIF